MLAAVILSAGASTRMGQPKALLAYREGTFLEHLIGVVKHPAIGVTRVVLGANAEDICARANLDRSVVVIHPDWEQGQLSSIWAGLRSLKGIETEGIVLCPVDHPLISARLVADLIDGFHDSGKSIVLPTFNGRRGHPVIFHQSLYSELLSASPEEGARAVVWSHAADVFEVPTDEEGVVLNINDPDMLRNAIGPPPA